MAPPLDARDDDRLEAHEHQAAQTQEWKDSLWCDIQTSALGGSQVARNADTPWREDGSENFDADCPADSGEMQTSSQEVHQKAALEGAVSSSDIGRSESGKENLLEQASDAMDQRDSLYSDVPYREDSTFIDRGDHIDVAQRVVLDGGQLAWLKPAAGESDSGREGLNAGEGARHNVASFEVDRALGLGVTPETRLVMTTEGEASLQDDAPGIGRAPDQYAPIDRQRMAVLDYVTAQTDRHNENFQTDNLGHPAAIDNGLCLSRVEVDPIRSDFVIGEYGKGLAAEILDGVSACDLDQLVGKLGVLGISKDAVEGVVRRIEEVRREGAITGDAWAGAIVSADYRFRVQ